MHEYGIAKEIINVIQDYARGNKGWTPVRCEVLVGAFCGLNPEALEAAFPMAVEGTIAENMEIDVSTEPIICKCRNCDSEIHIKEYVDLMICENCGSSDIEHPPSAQSIFITKLEIKKGDEVRAIDLTGVEVEEDEHKHKH